MQNDYHCEVQVAIKKMKRNKAAGPSGVVSDMLKAAGDAGTVWVTDVGLYAMQL